MGQCKKMKCFNCNRITNFFVNINEYKCRECGRTFPHPPIDEKLTTGYDYKVKKKQNI